MSTTTTKIGQLMFVTRKSNSGYQTVIYDTTCNKDLDLAPVIFNVPHSTAIGSVKAAFERAEEKFPWIDVPTQEWQVVEPDTLDPRLQKRKPGTVIFKFTALETNKGSFVRCSITDIDGKVIHSFKPCNTPRECMLEAYNYATVHTSHSMGNILGGSRFVLLDSDDSGANRIADQRTD